MQFKIPKVFRILFIADPFTIAVITIGVIGVSESIQARKSAKRQASKDRRRAEALRKQGEIPPPREGAEGRRQQVFARLAKLRRATLISAPGQADPATLSTKLSGKL